jgi:hypothetical protein
MFLVLSAHKNLCVNARRRAAIQGILDATPDIPAALATVVASVVAAFGPYGVLLGPIAGGMALMIARIGLDAFCLWAKEEIGKVRRLEKNTELSVYLKRNLDKLKEENERGRGSRQRAKRKKRSDHTGEK